MSVIIRLQNLPWSANALDIRQFFRGLSIPEGGVHIVGGEMGDAFIAFSTDEDARQAMMHDREAINGVQIRLLLSSRAEMQKVIETARQQSLLALKKSVVLPQPKVTSSDVVINVQKTVIATAPQPPVITASNFQNILSNSGSAATPSFLAYQQQAGFTLIPESTITNSSAISAASTKISNDSDDSESRNSRDRRRSGSHDRRRSKSRSRERNIFRRRRERSRDRSKERDWPKDGRRSSRHRSRSRGKSRGHSRERSRDRSHERSKNSNRDGNRHSNRGRSLEIDSKTKLNATPKSGTNAYQANCNNAETGFNPFKKTPNYQSDISNIGNSEANKSVDSKSTSVTGVPAIAVSTLQNYNTTNQSLTALNNYSLLTAGNNNDSLKGFALKNPYTTAMDNHPKDGISNTTSSSAIPGIFVEKKSDENNGQVATTMDGVSSLLQEPIAFANVNPYEQMYPNLFAQAAAFSSNQKVGGTKQLSNSTPIMSPKKEDSKPKHVDPNDTNCVKISNMCSKTTYSDLRKFFVGLFIPHNGIKMLNDKHGLRVGIAYVQFSRQSSVSKALCRSNNHLKGKSVIIEPVSEQEFIEAEDSFRPLNQEKAHSHRSNDSDNEINESGSNSGNGFNALNPYKKTLQLEPFTVLYIEDIPALATEQDIMKMFSSYSLYDILLMPSPENRREFVAYVRFSREDDAKSAYEDRAHHQIGYRRVRIRPGTIKEMENAKEKIRLANEQLIKEEKAAEEEEAKRKLEKLITEHITKEEKKQQHQNIVSMDLTGEDGDEECDIVETSEDLRNSNNNSNRGNENYVNDENCKNFDIRNNDMFCFQGKSSRLSDKLDPRGTQTAPQNNIPSLFDVDPMNTANLMRNQNRPNIFNDPRLRNMSERGMVATGGMDNNNQPMGMNNFNNFNPNFNNLQQSNHTAIVNNMENNFVILKNCEYNTRINDVAQLLLTANLGLKHIEPLRNERQLPTGEFIVEFRRNIDAEIAVQRFHNIQFRNRSLRVFPISPQEIADRLGKPFLGYIPGGNGIKMSKIIDSDNNMTRNNCGLPNNLMNNTINNNRFGINMPQNMNFNFRANNPFNDNNGPLNNNGGNNNGRINNGNNNNGGGGVNYGIPEQFTRPGCVLSLENVPYKAQLSDILRFFQGFDLTPDDIIRRFNDDGTPTGDARVAFISPDEARAAYESRKRKQIFGRNIYINMI